jgi:CheY-like chemotaxis protein
MTRCSEVCAASVPDPTRKILVVEDEVLVRLAVGQFLRDLGYVVIEAIDGAVAMQAVRADPTIALVFTDVIMPGDPDGRELADWLAQRYPEIKIVIASGVRQDRPDGVPFLLKPYAFSDLKTLVDRLLKP